MDRGMESEMGWMMEAFFFFFPFSATLVRVLSRDMSFAGFVDLGA
jgi:hypothetical protein